MQKKRTGSSCPKSTEALPTAIPIHKGMPNQLQNDRFRTYDQQIDILKNQKGLIISDETITKESLINIGYFSLIGGYKYPFKNPMTRKYINTTFEDIYALYKFDRELRELTFKYQILDVGHIRIQPCTLLRKHLIRSRSHQRHTQGSCRRLRPRPALRCAYPAACC